MKSTFQVSRIDDTKLTDFQITLKEFKSKVKNLLEILLDMKEIRFDISFCNDLTIQQINKEYRQKDQATDVITFSLFADDENSVVVNKTAELGEIIISLEHAKMQQQKGFEYELYTLVCHGILHLLGFDHLTKKDYDFVVNIQNSVLKNMGL